MMYIFFVTTLIAICYILRTVNDNPIEISRHTENLTNDMVFAVLKTCSTLQKQYNQDIQSRSFSRLTVLDNVLLLISYFFDIYERVTVPFQVFQSTAFNMHSIANLSELLTAFAVMTTDCNSNSFIVFSCSVEYLI